MPDILTTEAVLSSQQVEAFDRDGYLILDGFFEEALNRQLIAEVDDQAEGRITCTHACELPVHGSLIAMPRMLGIAEQLLGPGFHFTHSGTRRMGPGCGPSVWHHDYSQFPQSNRRHRMIGMLGYLSGLDGTIGDLVVLPGSHRLVMETGAMNRFRTEVLPDEVVIRAGAGTLAVLDAAIIHARRPQPGGAGRFRYLLDVNYCQAGVRWVGQSDWRACLSRVRELGLDRGIPGLIAEERFFDVEAARQRMGQAAGSLIMA
jgi:hypothetical protein